LNEIHALEQAGHNVAVFAHSCGQHPSVHPEFNELKAPIKYAGTITYDEILDLLLNGSIGFPTIVRQLTPKPSILKAVTLIRTKQCVEFVKELESEIDIIHTHFATGGKLPCLNVASYFNIPFTLTAHAYDIYKKSNNHTKKLFEYADRIVTISEYNRNYMRQEFGTDTPIDVVRAGIRAEKFTTSTPAEPNRILTVARHTKKKGLEYSLEAFAIALREFPELEYHLIGSGPLSDKLADQVDRLDIEKQVSFLHNVDDHQLIEEYDRARCFLLPCVITESGDRDGIPVALMEAMAMKTPPISTPISGIPELIDHGRNGLLVNPRDPEAIARELVCLLQNESMWNGLSRQGRAKVVEDFNIMKEVNKLEQTFETVQCS
jgi:glycosyltransferase involved in cell wall biosynthesis